MKKDYSFRCRNDWLYVIDQWILNERHRMIIKRRIIDGITLEDLAEEFDYSVSQIKNIVYACEKKLIAQAMKMG